MVLWAGCGAREEAYGLLEALVRTEYGLEELPPIVRTERGKPWFPSCPALCFNLSHSRGLLLCGTGSAPLGVDVEQVRPRRADLARYVLSEAECRWYADRGSRWEDLYGLWTLKEARCKCGGMGLTLPPRTIAVPLLEPGEAGVLDGLYFRAYGGVEWRAAACSPEEPPGELTWKSLRSG